MKIQNIVATVGTYKTKDGTEKKEYLTIGKFMTKDDGTQSVKIDCIPTWAWTGWANIYDQKKKEWVTSDQAPSIETDLPF